MAMMPPPPRAAMTGPAPRPMPAPARPGMAPEPPKPMGAEPPPAPKPPTPETAPANPAERIIREAPGPSQPYKMRSVKDLEASALDAAAKIRKAAPDMGLPEFPDTLIPEGWVESQKLPDGLLVLVVLLLTMGDEALGGDSRYGIDLATLATTDGLDEAAAKLDLLAKDKAFIKALTAKVEEKEDMGEAEDTGEEEMPKKGPPMPPAVKMSRPPE